MGPPPFLTLPTSRKKVKLCTPFFHVHLMANMCVLRTRGISSRSSHKRFPPQQQHNSCPAWLCGPPSTLQERIPENCKLRRRDRPSPSPSFACWKQRRRGLTLSHRGEGVRCYSRAGGGNFWGFVLCIPQKMHDGHLLRWTM